jgi:hypothetical protein
MKLTARLLHLTGFASRTFLAVFLVSYSLLALFLNYAHFYEGSAMIEGVSVNFGRSEPIYHFILRKIGLIAGGDFAEYDTHLDRIAHVLSYPLIGTYVIELIVFHALSLARRLNHRRSGALDAISK